MKSFAFVCALVLLTADPFTQAQACEVPGDFNGDDRVDNADLNLLLGAWSNPGWIPFPGDPCFNPFESPIDNGELNELLGNWGFGTGAGATSIPEPNTLGLLLAGLTVSLRTRRNTRNRT